MTSWFADSADRLSVTLLVSSGCVDVHSCGDSVGGLSGPVAHLRFSKFQRIQGRDVSERRHGSVDDTDIKHSLSPPFAAAERPDQLTSGSVWHPTSHRRLQAACASIGGQFVSFLVHSLPGFVQTSLETVAQERRAAAGSEDDDRSPAMWNHCSMVDEGSSV